MYINGLFWNICKGFSTAPVGFCCCEMFNTTVHWTFLSPSVGCTKTLLADEDEAVFGRTIHRNWFIVFMHFTPSLSVWSMSLSNFAFWQESSGTNLIGFSEKALFNQYDFKIYLSARQNTETRDALNGWNIKFQHCSLFLKSWIKKVGMNTGEIFDCTI